MKMRETLALFWVCLAGLVSGQGWQAQSPTPALAMREVASAVIGNVLFVVGQDAVQTCAITISPRSPAWDCSLPVRPFPGNHHVSLTPGDGTWWLTGGLDANSQGKVCLSIFFFFFLLSSFCRLTLEPERPLMFGYCGEHSDS
jgi:hypothetical protein